MEKKCCDLPYYCDCFPGIQIEVYKSEIKNYQCGIYICKKEEQTEEIKSYVSKLEFKIKGCESDIEEVEAHIRYTYSIVVEALKGLEYPLNSWAFDVDNETGEQIPNYKYPENNLLIFLRSAKPTALRAACKQNGLKGYSRKTRKDLIRMLMSL